MLYLYVLWSVLLTGCFSLSAQEIPIKIPQEEKARPSLEMRYKVGFAGRVRLWNNELNQFVEKEVPYARAGSWAPLQIEIINRQETFKGVMEVAISPLGRPYLYSLPFISPAPSHKVFSSYLPLSDNEGFPVHVYREGKLLKTEYPLLPTLLMREQQLILVLTGQQLAMSSEHGMLGMRAVGDWERRVVWMNMRSLPDRWIGLSGLAAIWIDGFTTSDTYRLSSLQEQALAQYVQSGGLLVVCGGYADAHLKNAGLAELLPVVCGPVQHVRVSQDLAHQFAQSRLWGDGKIAGELYLTSGTLRPTSEVLLAADDGTPFITRRRLGLGQVVFCAASLADPALRPISGATTEMPTVAHPTQVDRRDLGCYLLNQGQSPLIDEQGLEKTLAHPLRQTLFEITSIPIPSPNFVGGILLLYLLLLVPLNYWFWKRLSAPEYAWAMVPLLALLFGYLIYRVGYVNPGQALSGRFISLIQGRAEQTHARATHYISLFSNARQTYSFDIGNESHYVQEFYVGHNQEQRYVPSSPLQATFGQRMSIESCAFHARSVRTLEAIGIVSVGQGITLGSPLTIQLMVENADPGPRRFYKIQGHLTNRLPFALKDCWLLVAGHGLPLGEMRQGEGKSFDGEMSFLSSSPFDGSRLDPTSQRLLAALAENEYFRQQLATGRPCLVGYSQEMLAPIQEKGSQTLLAHVRGISLVVIELPSKPVTTFTEPKVRWHWTAYDRAGQQQKPKTSEPKIFWARQEPLYLEIALDNPEILAGQPAKLSLNLISSWSNAHGLSVEVYHSQKKEWCECRLSLPIRPSPVPIIVTNGGRQLCLSPANDYLCPLLGSVRLRCRSQEPVEICLENLRVEYDDSH